jgi:hypothetical protein
MKTKVIRSSGLCAQWCDVLLCQVFFFSSTDVEASANSVTILPAHNYVTMRIIARHIFFLFLGKKKKNLVCPQKVQAALYP